MVCMQVEVAYALADKQFLYSLNVVQGTTVAQAIAASPLFKDVPDLNITQVGIFSRPVTMDTGLRDGDRVEVYRPLKADPRERRRREVEAERQQA